MKSNKHVRIDKHGIIIMSIGLVSIILFFVLEIIHPMYLRNLAITVAFELGTSIPYSLWDWGIIGKKHKHSPETKHSNE